MIIQAANGVGPTSRILSELLVGHGINMATRDSVICYGTPYNGELPSLNRRAGSLNKLQQGQALVRAGVSSIQYLTAAEALAYRGGAALFGRTLQHRAGRDIKVALEPWAVEALVTQGSNFFTVFQPSTHEYRVWVYRRKHLGTYEKFLRRPQNFKRFGRNYDNGFVFERIEGERVPQAVKALASSAIEALDMDFGAVDIITNAANNYVLEVNSAPGVEGERRQVIQNLAAKIARWRELGHPTRRGERA